MQPSNTSPNTFISKIQNFVQEHRALVTILFMIFSVIFFIAIIFFTLQARGPQNPEDTERIPENAPYAYFEHRYLIESSIGEQVATKILFDVGNILIDKEETSSAPKANSTNGYAATISETSYRKSSVQSDFLYKVDFTMSDSRAYTMYIRVDEYYGENYITVVLDRTDSGATKDYAIIYTDNPDLYSNPQTDWINSLGLTNPQITTKPLPKPL